MSEVIYQGVDKREEIDRFQQELHQVQDGVIESENDDRTINRATAKINSMRNDPSYESKINFVYADALLAPGKFASYMNYINQKRAIANAIESEFGIPAAISLAQSLNESNAGTSNLAINNNNFFGLTCKGGDGHRHNNSTCTPKLDVDITQFFMNFAGKASDASWRAYAKRLTTLTYEDSIGPVYANCFRQKDLWGWCSTLGPIYAQADTYHKSLFTLITVFNLQWAGPTVSRPTSVRSNTETSSANYDILPASTTLFSAIQNKYTNDIAVYNRNHGLTGNALLTVNKLITYLKGIGFLNEVSGSGWTVPKGFTVDSIPAN